MSKRYVRVNENGEIIARYDEKINKDIPPGAIELTTDQWEKSPELIWINPETKEVKERAPRPSLYHDRYDDTGWIENTSKKETDEAETARIYEIKSEQEISGMKKGSVVDAKDKITSIFDGIREKPTDTEKLDALINKCELLFEKIAVELLE